MRPGTNLKLSTKRVIINPSNTFHKGHMDQLIERLSSLVRKGNDLFQQERPVQYGVLGGYLVLWLLISGSLTQTLLVGLAMGPGVDGGNPEGRLNHFKSLTFKRAS